MTNPADYPLASEIVSNVLVYEGDDLRKAAASPETRLSLMAEWVEAMTDGPGVIVLRNAFPDQALDAATTRFKAMIEEQRANNTGGGDHFAKPGANDRIWNALEKLCLKDPQTFAAYYGNEAIALVSEAWLGPAYQVTSQLNVVNPGGAAQSAHRDYHLGFQGRRHRALSGARPPPIADPHAAGRGRPLRHADRERADALPSLFADLHARLSCHRHGRFWHSSTSTMCNSRLPRAMPPSSTPASSMRAGHNRSKDIRRMANLLQVSSAYGRAMESVDRTRMSAALFPALRPCGPRGNSTAEQGANAVAACAEGYSFPTNLDRDPPIGGLAPKTQQALMNQALAEDWAPEAFEEALEKQGWRRLT